ncbi:MAG TPA: 2-C-methyl-D-erythritol 2,4-cyclodiphosphate synthase [Planctomycetota bacterium]|nr:2-C-methyl-D-erythritol 2,4-cyclodiphosphate synthase [Planctomycetota bacterium]
MTEFRVGTGFDLHRLEAGRRFVLGGVEIPFEKGPAGHSDGDVLLHAVADALLGAAGLDDLGSLFPDTDPRWKGADSSRLLAEVVAKVRSAGWAVVNVDAVVHLERPKIAARRGEIRSNLSRLLGVPVDRVNLKGKTAEALGWIGQGDAVAASAVALLAGSPPK